MIINKLKLIDRAPIDGEISKENELLKKRNRTIKK
jgi:hypothetical protein